VTDISKIEELLAREGVRSVGQMVVGDDEESPVLVSVMVRRDDSNRQVPSNKSLETIRAELAETGVRVEFLLRYGDLDDMEIGLRSTLLHSHSDLIRNVFLSVDRPDATVWIEPKSSIDSESLSGMSQRAREFLALFELKLSAILLTADTALPSLYALLNSIRLLAPVLPSDLQEDVRTKGFTVPSPDWLARKLDLMRKEGRIVRSPSGRIVLSLRSLQQLGTSKDPASPDVRRVLALARRRR